jgi:hypothetical protein
VSNTTENGKLRFYSQNIFILLKNTYCAKSPPKAEGQRVRGTEGQRDRGSEGQKDKGAEGQRDRGT